MPDPSYAKTLLYQTDSLECLAAVSYLVGELNLNTSDREFPRPTQVAVLYMGGIFPFNNFGDHTGTWEGANLAVHGKIIVF